MSRVLVVEDEEHLAEGLAFNLQNKGYEVTVAGTAREATETLDRARFDVILLDVMLPDGDGFEIAESLRRRRDFTPILMITAKGTTEDVVAGIEAGADGYVGKPFDLEELLARIRGLLRRQSWTREQAGHRGEAEKGGDPQPLEFAGCRVDFQTFRAIDVRGDEIELSYKEAMIMKLFADREGEVVTRQALLEEVWGVPGSLATRTVDNFILKLRKYFEPDPARPRHIISVRGAGYRFVR